MTALQCFYSCENLSYRGVFEWKHKKGYSRTRDHGLHNPEDLACLKVTMRSMAYRDTAQMVVDVSTKCRKQ